MTTELSEATYSTELKFKSLPFPVSISTSSKEILETLKTGLFRNQPVEWVVVSEVHSDDEEQKQQFVYNIEAAKSGQQPWTIKVS